jgi:hypothetical protein
MVMGVKLDSDLDKPEAKEPSHIYPHIVHVILLYPVENSQAWS